MKLVILNNTLCIFFYNNQLKPQLYEVMHNTNEFWHNEKSQTEALSILNKHKKVRR